MVNNIIRLFLLLLLWQSTFLFSVTVDIKIFQKRDWISLSAPGGVVVTRKNGQESKLAILRVTNHLIKNEFSVRPQKEGEPILVQSDRNPKRYRGILRISAVHSIFTVKNIVSKSEYLSGVVGCEMGGSFPLEALKVQAILARTLLQYSIENYGGRDLTDIDGHDQVYRGMEFENETVREAVRQTEGLVLTQKGQLLFPYFHSTCGGRIFPPNRERGLTDKKNTLQPIIDDVVNGKTNCSASPYFHWEFDISKAAVVNALSSIDNDTIITLTHSDMGYVSHVILSGHEPLIFPGYIFKSKLEKKGITNFRSVMFNLEDHGKILHVQGRGYGHLSGLCQYGAAKLAKEGWDYRKILKFYFSDCEVKREK